MQVNEIFNILVFLKALLILKTLTLQLILDILFFNKKIYVDKKNIFLFDKLERIIKFA